MCRILAMTSCLLVVSALSSAQTLGDIAKKEKERRKSVQKDGVSKVLTEEDLGSGAARESPGSTADPDADVAPDRPEIPDVIDPAGREASSGETAPADEWNDIYAEYQQRYHEAKLALEFYQAFEKHCEEGAPPPPLPPIPGGFWMINCDSFPQGVARAQQEMKEIENTCYDHARRLRVPPGRARLR